MGADRPGNDYGFIRYNVSPGRIDEESFFSGEFADGFSVASKR